VAGQPLGSGCPTGCSKGVRRRPTVEGEPGLAGGDDERLLLVRLDVLGDHPAGHAAPAEPDQMPVAVLTTAVNSIHSPVAGLKKGRKPVILVSPASPREPC